MFWSATQIFVDSSRKQSEPFLLRFIATLLGLVKNTYKENKFWTQNTLVGHLTRNQKLLKNISTDTNKLDLVIN